MVPRPDDPNKQSIMFLARFPRSPGNPVPSNLWPRIQSPKQLLWLSVRSSRQISSVRAPLRPGIKETHKKCQPVRRRCERYLRALGEVEHVARSRRHLLARLVGDFKLALEDDLHFIVGIFVNQRGAFLQPVEAGRDGFVGIVLVTGHLASAIVGEE